MRVWDISPSLLCRPHLLGEHREIHAVWSVITKGKKGYSKHPETLRWIGKLGALYIRHQNIVKEMKKRNYKHNSNLSSDLANGKKTQSSFINTVPEQIKILKLKDCLCFRTFDKIKL